MLRVNEQTSANFCRNTCWSTKHATESEFNHVRPAQYQTYQRCRLPEVPNANLLRTTTTMRVDCTVRTDSTERTVCTMCIVCIMCAVGTLYYLYIVLSVSCTGCTLYWLYLKCLYLCAVSTMYAVCTVYTVCNACSLYRAYCVYHGYCCILQPTKPNCVASETEKEKRCKAIRFERALLHRYVVCAVRCEPAVANSCKLPTLCFDTYGVTYGHENHYTFTPS